jgi:uncharacterized protein
MDPLISITIVLLIMLASIWRKMSLDATILLGVLLTSLLFGRIADLPLDFLGTITDVGTISLMLLVYLVFFLTNYMSDSGIMKKVVAALERMITDPRATILAIPMLIGFMPVLSGAVISAPFADEIGERANLTKEKRHIINYWFRHISEYVNPVYPGVILATSLLGVSYARFLTSNWPVMAVYALMGILFFLLPMGKTKKEPKRIRKDDVATIARGVSPILVAVALPAALNIGLPAALAIAILLALLLSGKPRSSLWKIAKVSLKMDLLILVLEVMLFSKILENTHATGQISQSLMSLGVPTLTLLISIPMLVGFLTGLTLGYVGLTLPILMPFIQQGGQVNMNYAVLAFVSGYMGVLLSPMHLCFSVTQKYFKADIKKSYMILLPPLTLTFLWTLVYVTLIM